jgi:hypothetical protein
MSKFQRLCSLLWLVAAVLFLTGPAQAEELKLSEVIANVSIQPPSTVAFDEQRHSAMLKEPLQLSGQLEYLGPGQLRKTIEQPFQETMLVNQQQIEVSRDGRTQRLSLKSNRMMQTLLGGIAAMLAGDTARLEKDFEPTLTGTETDWVLLLQPRNKRIAAHLQHIEVCGNAESVQSIRIQFDAQEWQLMELHPALPETP